MNMNETKKDMVIGNIEKEEKSISFKDFLELTHPSVSRWVREFWILEDDPSFGRKRRRVVYSDIHLHCPQCEGERTFRASVSPQPYGTGAEPCNTHPVYKCGDCQQETKQYALRISFNESGYGHIYKYGEYPAFGIPVPNRVLRLFGKVDSDLFLQGRQCENLGYGIAAFAYYRRVVENHKGELFDEIIKVCRTVGAPEELIEELNVAKTQISFAKSMQQIKTGLPQGLLINGQNPLNALHRALSVGLHNESDDDCLDYAQAVRLVLSDIVESIALLKQDKKELQAAVQLLQSKKS